jgi:hypothetical protein
VVEVGERFGDMFVWVGAVGLMAVAQKGVVVADAAAVVFDVVRLRVADGLLARVVHCQQALALRYRMASPIS